MKSSTSCPLLRATNLQLGQGYIRNCPDGAAVTTVHTMFNSRNSFRRRFMALAAFLAMVAIVAGGRIIPATASPVVGRPAPVFTGTDSQGRSISLNDFSGRIVVLEWTNHDCPFVRRHYDSGNMQALQHQAAAEGVIWLSIISSAPGEQGHVDGSAANELRDRGGAKPAAIILDPDGKIGRAYEAKTTPHMFIVNEVGTLVYMGAIDDQPRNTGANPATATNYVANALVALKEDRPIATPVTQPYGCAVKYESPS
jgi:hypothetical protein